MFDLHTHTIFSDGVLVPAESAQRARDLGYEGMAFTDHVDESNYRHVIESIVKFKDDFNSANADFKVLAGVELTHVTPSLMSKLVMNCRAAGADIIVVHGETIVEPVAKGTNLAAVKAGVDILAHPGLIDKETVEIGVKHGVAFEITTRKGHGYTNGHVAKIVMEAGGTLVVNNDFHAPGDMPRKEQMLKILKGIGLEDDVIETILENNRKLFKRLLGGTRG